MISSYFRKATLILGNLRLAIVLLLVIAMLSSTGTVIEQDQTQGFYQLNYPETNPLLGFVTYKLIFTLGLDHVYRTPWFLGILVVFGVSLISCTFTRQLPSLRMARLWQFYTTEKKFQSLNMVYPLQNASLSRFALVLEAEKYNVIRQGPVLYAYRGLIGKLGPIVVHISIIIVLLGAIMGSLFGFRDQFLIRSGDSFNLDSNSGFSKQLVQGQVQSFKIAYNEEGEVDQFYSKLSLREKGSTYSAEKLIYVNEPFHYQDLTLYQTDWSIAKIELLVDETTPVVLPLRSITNGTTGGEKKFWIGSIPGSDQETLLLIFQDLTGRSLLYNSQKELLASLEVGDILPINGHSIRLLNIIASTGIQVKSDPGIPVVYVGFLLLMISTLLSYVSYSQIWALKVGNTLYIGGQTNRAKYQFEQQLSSLAGITSRN
nr:c-type cytochrome biogenensis protein [Proteomonas sp. NEIS-1375]